MLICVLIAFPNGFFNVRLNLCLHVMYVSSTCTNNRFGGDVGSNNGLQVHPCYRCNNPKWVGGLAFLEWYSQVFLCD